MRRPSDIYYPEWSRVHVGMSACVPRPQRGDVLILGTTKSFSVFAVGRVSHAGQQDFDGEAHAKYVDDRATAEAEAKPSSHQADGCTFRNLDTGEWSEISN